MSNNKTDFDLDFDQIEFENDNKLFESRVELFGESTTGIYIFHNMHYPFYKELISNKEKYLSYVKEQLEFKNVRGHYVTNIESIEPNKYPAMISNYATSGVNPQIFFSYKYRYLAEDIIHVIKTSSGHVDKIYRFGEDIPIYGEIHPEISGFLAIKNSTDFISDLTSDNHYEKILNVITEYTRKGIVFPVKIYSYEMKSGAKTMEIMAYPVIPIKYKRYVLTNNIKKKELDEFNTKINNMIEKSKSFKDIQKIISLSDKTFFGDLEKGKKFLFDSQGVSYKDISSDLDNIDTKSMKNSDFIEITWDMLFEMIKLGYVSLFNMCNYYNSIDYEKDKYLKEYVKLKKYLKA